MREWSLARTYQDSNSSDIWGRKNISGKSSFIMTKNVIWIRHIFAFWCFFLILFFFKMYKWHWQMTKLECWVMSDVIIHFLGCYKVCDLNVTNPALLYIGFSTNASSCPTHISLLFIFLQRKMTRLQYLQKNHKSSPPTSQYFVFQNFYERFFFSFCFGQRPRFTTHPHLTETKDKQNILKMPNSKTWKNEEKWNLWQHQHQR